VIGGDYEPYLINAPRSVERHSHYCRILEDVLVLFVSSQRTEILLEFLFHCASFFT
jgi:hypothetical protein